MSHLSVEQLSAHLDHALTGRDLDKVTGHLAQCESCRTALEALTRQDRAIRPALDHDPGEAYFESLAERVEERIRGERAPVASGVKARGRGWFRTPRTLTWVAAAAAAIVGAGIVLVTSRLVETPGMQSSELRKHLTPLTRAESPSADRKKETVSRIESKLENRPPTPAAALKKSSDGGASYEKAPESGAANEIATAKPELDNARAISRAQEFAPAPPAGAKNDRAQTGHAYEVRRDASGEDVQVRREREFPPPPTLAPAPPPSPANGPMRVLKRQIAQPMSGAPSAPVETDALAPRSAALTPADSRAVRPVVGLEEQARKPGLLCGMVRDSQGQPVSGAQVMLADLGLATTTDARGRFCLSAAPGERTLSVLAVGFEPLRQPVTVVESTAEQALTLRTVAVLEGGRTLRVPRGGFASRETSSGRLKLAEPKDAYSNLPDSLRELARNAQRVTISAAGRRSAAEYDAAAANWERLLRQVEGKPIEGETRLHLAETRFHAWEAAPNERRRAAALEALTAYVVRAPGGREREQAAKWLDQVKP